MQVFSVVAAASGRGEQAWSWVIQVDRPGITMEALSHADDECASLDSKLLSAIFSVLTQGVVERELSHDVIVQRANPKC